MNARTLFSFVLTAFLASIVCFGLYTFLSDMEGPEITLIPSSERVSPQRELAVKLHDLAGLRSVTVSVRKNNQTQIVLERYFSEKRRDEELPFNLKNTALREGTFDLEIKAVDASLAGFGRGNARTLILPMRMDAQPPRVSVKNVPPHIRRGGCAVLLYTVNKEVRESGVRVGKYFFPAYRQEDGSYVCLFSFPYMLEQAHYTPELVTEDSAGNVTVNHVAVTPINVAFKQDTISVSDAFLLAKMPELQHLAPQAETPLEQYLALNRGIRESNEQALLYLGKKTASTMLWSGSFVRLPRSAERARFGDFRTYMYQGQKIDEQSHTGLDLASLIHADVPAANNGIVVFSDFLGIYGKLVVVDHGMGLMSLYSHLSDIAVQTGEEVKKGQILGQTGTTGLALGDHLHFGILVHGLEVQPLEWLDPKWIRDNVLGRMTVKAHKQ